MKGGPAGGKAAMSANGTKDPIAVWGGLESVLLQNLRVLDPGGTMRGSCDLWIRHGVLEAMAPELPAREGPSIDFGGALVLPGLFDMHVHFREPGGEDSETIASGARAAARGGFTGVACMPNTPVRIDGRPTIDLVHARAREACGTRVYPVGAMTRNLEGKLLTEMAELKDAGAVAVSDDGHPVENSEVMRRGMEYARMCGLTVLSHSEDRSLRGNGVMHEGYWSTVLGLRGIPAASEEVGVARDLALCELTGARLHLCHLSTRTGVELLRRAKEKGLPVTAEAAPHHLALDHSSLRSYDSSFKMNPPLRTAEDVAALREAVKSGLIDAIATDHAPHAPVLKDGELDQAPFGAIGLETSFGVCHRVLVEESGMELADLVERMAVAPRRILGLPGGRLEVGKPADLTILDLDWQWTVDPGAFASLSRNCPFAGWTLKGKVLLTVAAGRFTHAAVSPPAAGERVPGARG